MAALTVGVLVGHDPRQHFDQGDLTAKQGEEGGPLDADGTRACHQDVLGHLVEFERAVAVDDAWEIDAGYRRRGG